MPKKNNAVPHVHGRKHFHPCSSQKGNLKVYLAQPQKKIRRRRLRLIKAKRIFPRPVKMLRPEVTCPTVRYNMKKRLGRGFTLDELSAAKIAPRYAATIGIRVDRRRKNVSEESLKANVQRLKTYMSKLVLFPINHNKLREGEADEATRKAAVQDRTRDRTATVAHPATVKPAAEPMRKVSAEEAKENVYIFLKRNLHAARFLGERMARAEKKAKAKAEKK